MSAGASTAPVQSSWGLLRILGLGFSVAVVVGGTVGVGILRMPGDVAALLHTRGLIAGIWLLGGVYALLAALSVAEVATMFPQAGGFYVYARHAFGDGIGRLIGISDWLGQTAAISFGAVTMAQFLGFLLPGAAGAGTVTALAIIAALGLLSWSGLRASSKTQEWTTAAKAVAFLALVVACFRAPAAPAAAAAAPHGWAMASAYFLALQSVIVAYDGWYVAIYFTEEDTNPARTLPRAMIGSTLAIISLYLLVNLGYLHLLGADGLAASKQPAADAIARIANGAAGRTVTAVSILALVPLLNALAMCAPRILFGLSRDRLVWSGLSSVNPRGTPVSFVATILTAAFLALTGTFSRLIAMCGFLFVVNHCTAILAVLALRRREPALPRPFRVPFYPWVPLAAVGGGVSFLAGTLLSDPLNSGLALAILALYPAFRLARRNTSAAIR